MSLFNNDKKTETERRKARILVAPLDWGLGHTTRCIPIINELLLQGCEVVLAGNNQQQIILKEEFPELRFESLTGYEVRYAGLGSLAWKMIKQIPRIKKIIQYEHNWLSQKIDELNIDAVISDNRYGLHTEKIPCVFITHQLSIKSPWKWTEKFLQNKNYKYINRFSECWIPDDEGENNLAGELSHPNRKPVCPVKYLSALSRFKKTGIEEIKKHLLIILSGPEPQRTFFENIIVKQIGHYNGSATIVRGLPASGSLIPSTNSIRFYNHLPADKMNEEIEKAEFVIARSGYSTIMDAMTLHKKGILVPTPGQTEQEYLAKYLSDKQICITEGQKKFSLPGMLDKAENFSFRLQETDTINNLKINIERFLTLLSL
jgi:UDP-N-acetylglucosamine transferase subunit ALG13